MRNCKPWSTRARASQQCAGATRREVQGVKFRRRVRHCRAVPRAMQQRWATPARGRRPADLWVARVRMGPVLVVLSKRAVPIGER
jgi:hypothetical protein